MTRYIYHHHYYLLPLPIRYQPCGYDGSPVHLSLLTVRYFFYDAPTAPTTGSMRKMSITMMTRWNTAELPCYCFVNNTYAACSRYRQIRVLSTLSIFIRHHHRQLYRRHRCHRVIITVCLCCHRHR